MRLAAYNVENLFESLELPVHAASDHAAIWVDLDI